MPGGAPWWLEPGRSQAPRQRRAQGVAGNVHGLAVVQQVRWRRPVALASAQPLACSVQAQKLLQLLLSVDGGLPQQKMTRFIQLVRQRCGKQGACAHAPQPKWPAGVFSQPAVCMVRILQPRFPGGVGKEAFAVTTPRKIHLQHAVAGLCQRPRLLCDHAPRAVDLFGKRVQVQHATPKFIALRRVEQAKALPGAGW